MAQSTKTQAAALITTALSWAYGVGADRKAYDLPLADIGFPQGVPAPAHYLLFNGFKQSMADSIAGYAKELREEVDEDGERVHSDGEVHDLVIEALDERFQGILAGTVGFGTQGPRLRGMDKMLRDIAEEEVRNLYADPRNKALEAPQVGSPQWKAIVDKYMARNTEKLKAEAERRLALKASADDLAAILGDEDVASAASKVAKPKAKAKAPKAA